MKRGRYSSEHGFKTSTEKISAKMETDISPVFHDTFVQLNPNGSIARNHNLRVENHNLWNFFFATSGTKDFSSEVSTTFLPYVFTQFKNWNKVTQFSKRWKKAT